MAQLKATLTWTKSPDTDIVRQHLQVKVNDVVPLLVDQDLTADIGTFDFKVEEKSKVHVEIWPNDGTSDGPHTTLDVVAPDTTAPLPITDLKIAFAPV